MTPYQIIDHTADVGMEVTGKTLEELFKNAGEAFCDLICDRETIEAKKERRITLQKENREELLHAFLNELLYLFETEYELYSEIKITVGADRRVCPKEGEHIGSPLRAVLRGEKIDPSRHEIKTGIKAVTHHQLSVKKEGAVWKARVIFDV